MSARPRLERLAAPMFWTRWAVVLDGQQAGTVEKEGRFAPGWVSRPLGAPFQRHRTRAEAVARVVAAAASDTPVI